MFIIERFPLFRVSFDGGSTVYMFSLHPPPPDWSTGLEGGLGDVAIEVLHMLLCHLLQNSEEDVGLSRESVDTFVQYLRRDFPRERVPVVLAPLLYRGQQDITEERCAPLTIIVRRIRLYMYNIICAYALCTCVYIIGHGHDCVCGGGERCFWRLSFFIFGDLLFCFVLFAWFVSLCGLFVFV